MNRVTASIGAFLLFFIGVSAWLLTRAPSHPTVEQELATNVGTTAGARAGMTFAEWAVRSDGILLADIDPGQGVSTVPRRFLVLDVKPSDAGRPLVTDGASFSWAAADRPASAGQLFVLGYRVNLDGLAFSAPADPLWSDPIPRVEGAEEQTVKLKAKGGAAATFTRRHADPNAAPYWNRRAIGFLSPDGNLVYVTPDAIVVPAGAHDSP